MGTSDTPLSNEELKVLFDKLAQNADYLISNPETIETAKNTGLAIKSKFIKNEDFLEELFESKKKLSQELIKELVQIDQSIANSTLHSLYEELREAFVLGIFGSSITLALIYLELGFKYRLYAKRKDSDPNASWDAIEQMDLKATVQALYRANLLTKEQKEELEEFNTEVRNKYIHYNIKAIVADMVLTELPAVNLVSGTIEVHKNVVASEMPIVWFSAKKVKDKKTAPRIVNYCIKWVNEILSNK